MTPAFGFSVGDFISGINLVRKITQALKETGGASSEYQAAVIELKGLKHALQHLQALEPTEDNLSHVNAIRGMALACQLPLREFLTKLERYESSLGPWADRTNYRGAGRKARWALEFAAEVDKLRALVAAKQISINLLLATHASQTISSINTRTKQDHGTLMSKIAEQRATLHQTHISVRRIESRIEGLASNFRAVSSKVDQTHLSVMSLRSLGEQIMAFIRTFPHEIRDLLQSIVQAEWRTYQAVLQIQERLARSPTSLHDSNIRFTNVLGEYRELPYEYFCQWEPFEGFLRAQFKNKPGESKVVKDQFYILNANNHSQIVRKEHWSRSISQGANITMSMIMYYLQRRSGSCLRPGCPGIGTASNSNSNAFSCATCHLTFFSNPDDIENTFGRGIVPEGDIARQQIEEDLLLYGSRPEPPDTVEIDEFTQLASLPPKRDAPEFEAAVGRLAKMRKKGKSKEFNYQTLTIIDWNSGASPLDTWLNQSAVPSITAAINRQEPNTTKIDLLPQETEEIKVFRNVHVTAAPSPEHNNAPLERVEGLSFPAKIYYRNIVDNYPAIPVYLARRLAQANSGRAERLRIEREHHHQKEYKDTETYGKLDCRIQIPDNVQIHSFLSLRSLAQGDTAPPRRETISPTWPTSTQEDAKDARSYHKLQLVDFWTGGSQCSRPTSARSRSPGGNSTSHGRLGFDLQEQNSTFANEFTARMDFRTSSSRGLPAPPVQLDKVTKFDCDICGKNVHVKRRLEWQSHVLNDLRPYVCIFRECSHATYASLGDLLDHELSVHGEDSEREKSKLGFQIETCVFCGEVLPTAAWESCSRHVGHHMEEIAFTVVTKPYKDWDFYSDVDASSFRNQGTDECDFYSDASSVRYQGTDEIYSTSTSHDAEKD